MFGQQFVARFNFDRILGFFGELAIIEAKGGARADFLVKSL